MARRSSVEHLPFDVQRLVVSMVVENRYSIDQLLFTIRAAGGDVSRSAVGRFIKRFHDQMPRGPGGSAARAEFLGRFQRAGLPKPRVRVKAPSRRAA